MSLAAILLTALFTSAVRLPASECAVAGAQIGKSCRMHCCANKSCCLESQKRQHELPKTPLTRDNGFNQQLVAIIAFHLTADRIEFPEKASSPYLSAMHVTHPAPKPALLCTFLI